MKRIILSKTQEEHILDDKLDKLNNAYKHEDAYDDMMESFEPGVAQKIADYKRRKSGSKKSYK